MSSIRNPCSSGPFQRNSLEVDNPKLSFYVNIVHGWIDMPSRCTNRYVRASVGRPRIAAVRGIDYDSCRRLEFCSRDDHSDPLLAVDSIPLDFHLAAVSKLWLALVFTVRRTWNCVHFARCPLLLYLDFYVSLWETSRTFSTNVGISFAIEPYF